MKMLDKSIFLLIGKMTKKAMISVLSGVLPRDSILALNSDIWRDYGRRVADLKKQNAFGSKVMIRLSLLTLIVFEQLVCRGLSRNKAIKLTSEINWIVYEKLTNRFWVLTRLLSKRPIIRVEKAMNFFIKVFPYRKPDYDIKILETENNDYAFNVFKCPSAEFFEEHELSELCVRSWCDLDYPLAKIWGVDLKRDKTLAGGENLCNFRFSKMSSAEPIDDAPP